MTSKQLMAANNVEIIISSSGQLIVRCDDKTVLRVAKVKNVSTTIPANGDGGVDGTWTSQLYRRGGYDK